jgi:hypothetical protein
MPGKKRFHSKRKSSNAIKVAGSGYIGTVSCVNGAWSSGRWQIDTTLCTQWTEYAKLYERWRVKKLDIIVVPDTSDEVRSLNGFLGGNFFMCILEDPEDAVPTTLAQVVSQRIHKTWHLGYGKTVSMSYVPRRESWLFTQDNAVNADRLEMPGDIVIGVTATWDNAAVVANFYIKYHVEFDNVKSSTITSAVNSSVTIKPKVKQLTNNNNTDDEAVLKKLKELLNIQT